MYVVVSDWNRRRDAITYLHAQGYEVTKNGIGRSPDGRYIAHVSGPARSRGEGAVGVSFEIAPD